MGKYPISSKECPRRKEEQLALQIDSALGNWTFLVGYWIFNPFLSGLSPWKDNSGWAARSAGFPTCRFADFPVGRASVARQPLELPQRPAGWKTCGTADKNVCATNT